VFCAGAFTVHLRRMISPATTFSAKLRQPAVPQAPQLDFGSSSSTASMRGSSKTYSFLLAIASSSASSTPRPAMKPPATARFANDSKVALPP
jgi:hypothetical protein